MSNVTIITDSTCDLLQERLNELNVQKLHLTYSYDDKEFDDVIEDTEIKKFYQSMRDGKLPKTSAVSPEKFEAAFSKALESGNDVVCITLISKGSATYSNANSAKDSLQKKFPERKIFIIDSLTTSAGMEINVRKAVELRDEGKSAQEIFDFLEKFKYSVQIFLAPDNLFHLTRGGRLSKTSAAIGSLLNIKPIIFITKEGSVDVYDKVKGRKKVMQYFLDKIKEHVSDPSNDAIYVGHSDCVEDAAILKQMIEDEFNAKNVEMGYIGTVIGTHVGPDSLAVFFCGKERTI